jgi:hypothetical protein
MKVCEVCGDEIFTVDGDNRCDRAKCQNAPEVEEDVQHKPFTIGAVLSSKPKRKRQKSAQTLANEACGLRRVRGALGGIYWE